jgi:hypothetical protein
MTFIWAVLGVLGVVPAVLFVAFIDAPGSLENPLAIILVLTFVSFPPVCFGAIIMSHQHLRTEQLTKAQWWITLPTINLIIVVLWIYLSLLYEYLHK